MDSPLLTSSFDSPSLISSAHSVTQELARHQLVDDSTFRVSGAADAILSSESGRAVFSLLVACALPADVTIVATTPLGEFTLFGEMGLAPKWLRAPLDHAGRGWVSACVFARLNPVAEEIVISVRGPHPALHASRDERGHWPVQEGAFYGDLFTEPDRPIEWITCRGTADPSSPGLVDRRCSKPDPADPGRTLCGFVFAGTCADICDSDRGFYRRCASGGEGFRQVITTYGPP